MKMNWSAENIAPSNLLHQDVQFIPTGLPVELMCDGNGNQERAEPREGSTEIFVKQTEI